MSGNTEGQKKLEWKTKLYSIFIASILTKSYFYDQFCKADVQIWLLLVHYVEKKLKTYLYTNANSFNDPWKSNSMKLLARLRVGIFEHSFANILHILNN